MEQALVASLEAVAEVMENTQDPWWIIASAAVTLHGANPGHVGDVDVLLSLRDARRVIPTLGLALQPGAHHAEFRSTIFATWREPPLPVEFMAGFQHCQDGRWRTIVPATSQRIALDGKTWFVPIALNWGISCSRSAAPRTLHGQLA